MNARLIQVHGKSASAFESLLGAVGTLEISDANNTVTVTFYRTKNEDWFGVTCKEPPVIGADGMVKVKTQSGITLVFEDMEPAGIPR